MKTSNSSFLPMIGGSSLLVIFAVLCLTLFSLLSISTAQADGRLSDASIKAVTDYYVADLEAEKIFAQLRECSATQDAPGKDLQTRDSLPKGVTIKDNIYSYQCKISDKQFLDVQIEKKDEDWTVLRWQAQTCE